MDFERANGHRYHGLLRAQRRPVEAPLRADPRSLAFDLEEATRAVLGMRTEIPEDAFTAGSLGTEREGSAVLIGEDGLAVTIGYLVTEAARVVLTDHRGVDLRAELVGYDQVTGLGLVRALDPVVAKPMPVGDSAGLRVGATGVVAGHGGLDQALAVRVVSRREFAGYWEYLLDEAIFTTPPHPHWSGGALIDATGALAGIGSLHVQDAVLEQQNRPGNMFVPIDLLAPIRDDLVRYGRASRLPRPWLGMFASEIDGQVMVAGLIDDGPAHAGGIRIGDAIVGVGDEDVSSLAEFYRRVWALGTAGVDVPVRVQRDGRVVLVHVRSADRGAFLKHGGAGRA